MQDYLQQRGYTAIPLFKNEVGHFGINVILQGFPTHFILDTGAASSVLDMDFAEKHQFMVEKTDLLGGGVGTSALDIYKVHLASFTVGDLEIGEWELYIADLQHVKDSLIKKGIQQLADGVLGADVLLLYQAIIDYGGQQLYLKCP
ncbi:MAG: clan AA aspartic protease [Flavisolibacter sp.]|nr:clan AA aspartic protease [Flavisolibacter sp.]